MIVRRRKTRTPLQRFCAKVELPADPNGCWEWRGWRSPHGYGGFHFGVEPGRTTEPNGYFQSCAHRFSYEAFVGPITDGFEPDHLCRNRGCVNPAHLQLVSHQENVLRGDTFAARQARQTECGRGHRLPDQRNKWGRRECVECTRIRERQRNRRRTA